MNNRNSLNFIFAFSDIRSSEYVVLLKDISLTRFTFLPFFLSFSFPFLSSFFDFFSQLISNKILNHSFIGMFHHFLSLSLLFSLRLPYS